MSSGFRVTLPGGNTIDLSDILMEFSNLMKPTVVNNYYFSGAQDFTSLFGARDNIPGNAAQNTGYKVTVGGETKDISSFFNKKNPVIYADITGSKQYDGNEPNIIPVYRVSSDTTSDQVTINGGASETSNFQNSLKAQHAINKINHIANSHRQSGSLNSNHYNISIPGYTVHVIGEYAINRSDVSISIENNRSEMQHYDPSYSYSYSYPYTGSLSDVSAITTITISGIIGNDLVQLQVDSNIIINSANASYLKSETTPQESVINTYNVRNGVYQIICNVPGTYSISIFDNNNYNNNSILWQVVEQQPSITPCFVSGTKVLMADDSWIKIEELIINDTVMTVRIPTLPYTSTTPYYNSWNTSTLDGITLGTSKVTKINTRWVGSYILINDLVKITEEHYVFSKKQGDSIWKFYYISEINIGDTILDDNLEETIITTKVTVNEAVLVYSFTLDVDDVYIVKGMVAHMSTL
jgi:hypothetical protein